MHDVAIVGAGYAGLVLAWKLAKAGVKVTVYEEHGENRIGQPRHCTGLVSVRVVEGLDAWRLVLDKYKTVELAAGEDTVALRPRGGVYRLDRVGLEKLLYERSIEAGARFEFNAKVERVDPEKGDVYVDGHARRHGFIAVATGSLGSVRGLEFVARPRKLTGWNIIYASGRAPPEATIRVDFTRGLSTGFFAWILKTSAGVLAGSAAAPGDAGLVRRRLEEAYSLRDRLDAYGGVVLAGPPASPLVQGRVVLVGDAGGLVKPLTGGGLYPGLVVAGLAASMLNRGVNPGRALFEAVERVAARLRRQYRVARVLHSDPGLVEEGIRYARNTGLGERLSDIIDYDAHESVGLLIASRLRPGDLVRLLARPRLLAAGLRMLAAGIGGRLRS